MTPTSNAATRRTAPLRPSSVPLASKSAQPQNQSNAGDLAAAPNGYGSSGFGYGPGTIPTPSTSRISLHGELAINTPTRPTGFVRQSPSFGTRIPDFVRDALCGPGRTLDNNSREEMEARFGQDFSRVRIHDDGRASSSAFVLGAAAYTVGRDIVLGRCAPAPGTNRGRALLAHELAHVVQQERGGPVPGNGAHSPEERDADAAARSLCSGVGPVGVENATGVGLACAPVDWIFGSPDVSRWDLPYLVKERDQLQSWLDGNKTSNDYFIIKRALIKVDAEITEKEGKPPAEPVPRILSEQTSVKYIDADSMRAEYDLIAQWLRRRKGLSQADRQVLETELHNLAPAGTIRLGTNHAPGAIVDFETPKTRLGDLEVHFTGHLSIKGSTTLMGQRLPSADQLPKAEKGESLRDRIGKWAAQRVREEAQQVFKRQVPTGSARHIELEISGEKLVLDLAQQFAMPGPFVVFGRFGPSTKNIRFGIATIPDSSVSLDAIAWITPGAAHSRSDPWLVGEVIDGFTWAKERARFVDTHQEKKMTVPRTGALFPQAALSRVEKELHPAVKGKWALIQPSEQVEFLQKMRSYFGTDDRTIAHFRQLRPVRHRGKDTPLIMHEEAASRLEAVEQELGPDKMPDATVGWPRGRCSLADTQRIDNLHNIGFAVDLNATETPNLKSTRLRELVELVTGKVEMSTDLRKYTTGKYDDMAKKNEKQRNPMAVPDPSSELGELLEHIEKDVQDASDRSELFRHSLDVGAPTSADGATAIAKLRQNYLQNIWGAEQEQAFQQVTQPWKKIVDDKLTQASNAVRAAGSSLDAVVQSHALVEADAAKLKQAIKTTAEIRAKIKDNQVGGNRKSVEEQLTILREALHLKGTKATGLDSDALLNELDTLKAIAEIGIYDDLRQALDDPSWVFGPNPPPPEIPVVDPPPAQLVERGFFTLRPYSHSAKGGTAQGSAFDVAFVKAMVKHGFMLGATWGAQSGTDFMHFELRWYSPVSHQQEPHWTVDSFISAAASVIARTKSQKPHPPAGSTGSSSTSTASPQR